MEVFPMTKESLKKENVSRFDYEKYKKKELLKRRALSSLLLVSIMINVVVTLSKFNAAYTDGVSQDTELTEVHSSVQDYSNVLSSDVNEVDNTNDTDEVKVNVDPLIDVKEYFANGREDEIDLLERIVAAESIGEGERGQIAVTNVILNRLSAPGWPKELYKVVFSKYQFTPALTGKVYRVKVTEEVRNSVRKAINGSREVDSDVFYFVNPKLATDLTIPNTKVLVKVIGSHCFYKD